MPAGGILLTFGLIEWGRSNTQNEVIVPNLIVS